MLILRVGWGINGTEMEFKIFSVFLLHSLACFLHYFTIVFSLNIVSFKKRWIIENMLKISFAKSIFLLILRVSWAVNGTKMEFKISSIIVPHSLACFLDFFSIIFFFEHSPKRKRIIENIVKTSFFKLLYILDPERYLSFWWL